MPEVGSCGVAFAAIDSKEAALKRFSGPNRAEHLLLIKGERSQHTRSLETHDQQGYP